MFFSLLLNLSNEFFHFSFILFRTHRFRQLIDRSNNLHLNNKNHYNTHSNINCNTKYNLLIIIILRFLIQIHSRCRLNHSLAQIYIINDKNNHVVQISSSLLWDVIRLFVMNGLSEDFVGVIVVNKSSFLEDEICV